MTSDVILRVLRTPGKFESDAGHVDGPQHNEVSTITSAERGYSDKRERCGDTCETVDK